LVIFIVTSLDGFHPVRQLSGIGVIVQSQDIVKPCILCTCSSKCL